MKFNYLTLLALILTPLIDCAADNRQNAEDYITLHFCAASWKQSIREPLYYQLDGEYLPLRLTTTSRTRPVDYHGPNPITFYAKQADNQYLPIAQANIPEGFSQALLLFFHQDEANDASGRFSVKVIDDNETLFPRNSYRFINFCADEIIGKLGSEKFSITANSAKTIEPKQTPNNQLSLQLAEVNGREAKMIYSSVWPFQPNTRKLVVLAPPDGNRMEKLSMVIIPDYMPLESE
ncbi:hypothetical protein [Cerasicoccus fimbriatus]|uniref:hypothetical protein n=1 Tax=Cerasicoccus fimbriatus TaxID=3014554 RepID=UPI0022B5B55C|nr:hypothetical protein [Cerasicoccus sp. TK19100]